MHHISDYLANQSFLQMPRWLTEGDFDPYEQSLYVRILDLAKLSEQNGYQDESGVYVFLTLEQIQGILRCSQGKAVKTLRSLEQRKLLRRKQQGLGKANLYYPTPPQLPPDSVTETPAKKQDAAITDPTRSAIESIKQRAASYQNQGGQTFFSSLDHEAIMNNYRPPF